VSLQGRLAHFGAPGARRGVRGARPTHPPRLVSGTSTPMGGSPCRECGVRFGGLKSVKFNLVKFGLLLGITSCTMYVLVLVRLGLGLRRPGGWRWRYALWQVIAVVMANG
jgi:hypothetical protein